MRGLFEVYVVDPEADSVVVRMPAFVARDRDAARLKCIASSELDRDIDEYDICVVKLGDVRDKKEVQEVKIIE